jgi:hypothetical protein
MLCRKAVSSSIDHAAEVESIVAAAEGKELPPFAPSAVQE